MFTNNRYTVKSNGKCRPLVVHVIPKEKFTQKFIAFSNEAFSSYTMHFILYGEEQTGFATPEAENVLTLNKKSEIVLDNESRSLLKECNLIVLNWVDWKVAAILYPVIRKLLLCFWGGDLYPYVVDTHDGNVAIKDRLWLALRQKLVREAKGIITLTPGDLAIVEKISPVHGPWYLGVMYGRTRAEIETFAAGFSPADQKSHPYRILVGNSATSTNRHEEIFRALSRFKEEEIEIFCPLSYGEEEYKNRIVSLGRELFGSKFKPLLEFMPFEEYQRLLQTISIGVFAQHRQQGMGNINMLLRCGAKVFISRESTMWDDFASEGKVCFPVESIDFLSFEEFSKYSKEDAGRNRKALDLKVTYNHAVASWEKIYQASRSK